MTKTIVIGAPEPQKKELKPIKFISYLDQAFGDKKNLGAVVCPVKGNRPRDFKFIELICLKYIVLTDYLVYDLMFGYDDPNRRGCGILFIGKWNDGVV